MRELEETIDCYRKKIPADEIGSHPCFCVGPQRGEKFCPCVLRQEDCEWQLIQTLAAGVRAARRSPAAPAQEQDTEKLAKIAAKNFYAGSVHKGSELAAREYAYELGYLHGAQTAALPPAADWQNDAATVMARFVNLSSRPDEQEWAQTAVLATRLLNTKPMPAADEAELRMVVEQMRTTQKLGNLVGGEARRTAATVGAWADRLEKLIHG